jgi:coproporphyrinogen III oxidase
MKTKNHSYFFHEARKEARGVGGVFFDDLTAANGEGPEKLFAFVKDCLEAFPRA